MRYYLILSEDHLHEVALSLLKANTEADYYSGESSDIIAAGNGREAWLFLLRHHNDYYLDSFENIKSATALIEKFREKYCGLYGDSAYDI